jgi:hypothetical protein
MKKIASILAVALFALGMIATQADNFDIDFDIETMLACSNCDPGDDPRGGTA